MESNQRRYPRRTAFIFADYTLKKGSRQDLIENIRAGGRFIRTWDKVAMGQRITLRFPLFSFEQTIKASGTISRTEPLVNLPGGIFPRDRP